MPVRLDDDDDSNTSNFISKPVADVHYVNQTGDIMEGDLNLNNNKILNAELKNCTVSTQPTLGNELVNKNYLDTRLSTLDSIYVNESGDTLKGYINMGSHRIINLKDPVNLRDAVNKKYADQYKTHFTLEATNLSVIKPITMQSNKITNLGQPTDDNDAATKLYVDTNKYSGPKILSINIDEIIPGIGAEILISDIDLGISDESRLTINDVHLIFNYHPFVKQISRSIRENKLNLTINVEHSSDIGQFNLNGIIIVKPMTVLGPTQISVHVRRIATGGTVQS